MTQSTQSADHNWKERPNEILETAFFRRTRLLYWVEMLFERQRLLLTLVDALREAVCTAGVRADGS
jgi:hypothetical protein